jgi:hypothetical protein
MKTPNLDTLIELYDSFSDIKFFEKITHMKFQEKRLKLLFRVLFLVMKSPLILM